MTLESVLRDVARFSTVFRDRDIALEPSPRRVGHSVTFATDRSGGEFVFVDPADANVEPGVWLHSSEGERHRLAPDLCAFFEHVGRGLSTADLVNGRDVPSLRALPGVLRWIASLAADEFADSPRPRES